MNELYNKVVLNGKVLLDISSDTIDAAHLIRGYTAHNASGEAIVGTAIESGESAILGTKSITSNGTYNASSDSLDGYSSVTVNVPTSSPTGTKQISITSNDTITEDVASYAFAQITTNVSLSTPEVTISTSGAVTQELQPNTIYHFTSTALTSLTLTFGGTATDQYHFDFISPSTAATLTLPSTVTIESSFNVEANTKYEIDIVNNEGVYAEWAVSSV